MENRPEVFSKYINARRRVKVKLKQDLFVFDATRVICARHVASNWRSYKGVKYNSDACSLRHFSRTAKCHTFYSYHPLYERWNAKVITPGQVVPSISRLGHLAKLMLIIWIIIFRFRISACTSLVSISQKLSIYTPRFPFSPRCSSLSSHGYLKCSMAKVCNIDKKIVLESHCYGYFTFICSYIP